VVHVAVCGEKRFHVSGTELPVRRRDPDDLAAGEPLGGAALVGGDVGGRGRDDAIAVAQERGQRRHVGAGAVEDEEDVGMLADVRPDRADPAGGPRVVTVCVEVPVVRFGDGDEYRRVRAGVVV